MVCEPDSKLSPRKFNYYQNSIQIVWNGAVQLTITVIADNRQVTLCADHTSPVDGHYTGYPLFAPILISGKIVYSLAFLHGKALHNILNVTCHFVHDTHVSVGNFNLLDAAFFGEYAQLGLSVVVQTHFEISIMATVFKVLFDFFRIDDTLFEEEKFCWIPSPPVPVVDVHFEHFAELTLMEEVELEKV